MSFAKCVKDRMYVHMVRLFDADTEMVLAKSGFISGGFCSGSGSYDGALEKFRATSVEGCEERG